MEIYKILFMVLGFQINSEDEKFDKMVEIELGENVIIPKMKSRKKNNKNDYNYNYIINIIIFCIISWQIFYAITNVINKKNMNYLNGCMFQIIFALQYLISVKYFKGDHLNNLLCDNDQLKIMLNKKIILTIITTIFISILLLIFVVEGINLKNESILNLINKKKSGGIFFIYFLSVFFGYLVFLTNISIFSVIMNEHTNDILKYIKNLEQYVSSSVSISEKVSRISIEIVEQQEKINESVQELNLLFSTTSALGLLYIFIITQLWSSGVIISTDIINFIIFVTIEYFYVKSAQVFRTLTNDISSKIKLPIYMSNLMQKNNINKKIHPIEHFDDDKIYETMICTQIYVIQIIEYQSLQQLQLIINEPWPCFELFGLQINDTTIIYKFIGIIMVVFIAGNLSDAFSFQI